MSQNPAVSNSNTSAAIESLEDLLTDLDLAGDADPSDDAIVEALDAADEALDASDEAAIDAVIEREVVYETQVSEASVTIETAAPADKTSEPSAPKTSKTAKPKMERDLSSLPDEVFTLEDGVDSDKAAVIALRPAQKKIAEKFDNLFVSIGNGSKPSGYTMQVFAALASKGEATSAELVAALKAAASRKGSVYADGTARSQVGQMMNLFAAVKIATRVGNKLIMNPNSVLVAKLKAL